MKKIYMILIAGMFTSAAVGQEPGGYIKPGKEVNAVAPSHHTSNRAVEEFWLGHAYSKNNSIGNKGKSYSYDLFSDSTVWTGNAIDGYYRPDFHSFGNVLDPYADLFNVQDNVIWTKSTGYTVDSIELGYSYKRKHPNAAIVDTLVVYLYSNAVTTNLATGSFETVPPAISGWQQNFGLGANDTLWFKYLLYDYLTNKPLGTAPLTGQVVIKVPLIASDTTIGIKNFSLKRFTTNSFNVTPGKLAVSAYFFKPGYTYIANDTISKTKNVFSFISYEEQGTNTFPVYPGVCNQNTCDWNVSSILTTTERYNTSTNGWNGTYRPSWQLAKDGQPENHFISYKVTSTTVGIKETVGANGIKLAQNQPNPFNGSTFINYEISATENVSLDIFDIAGKKIVSLNQGKQSAGVHSIEVSSQNLPQGVYFYTLNVGDKRVTKKMTVLE